MEKSSLIKFEGAKGQQTERALALGILAELQIQKERGKSYFDQVPAQYRETVRRLARDNFPHHENKFGSLGDFLEAISQNWLAKKAVFGKLAEAAGFTRTQGFDNIPAADRDKYASAMLTRSASFLLVGTGAFSLGSSGAAYQYTKIDLRKDGPENITSEAGGHFGQPPRVGDSAVLSTVFKTSEVISMYLKRMGGEEKMARQSIRKMNETMTGSFIDIDHQTIVGRTRKPEK